MKTLVVRDKLDNYHRFPLVSGVKWYTEGVRLTVYKVLIEGSFRNPISETETLAAFTHYISARVEEKDA